MISMLMVPVTDTIGADKTSETKTVRLERGDGLFGLDVISKDGRKVGDIVDFAFEFDGAPGITHVLVMSGGFLDMGGDVRAVPAGMITTKDDRAVLDATADTFNKAPIVSSDRSMFFSDSALVKKVNEHFGRSSATSDKGSSKESMQTVLYSGLNRNRTVGSDGVELGRITDVWLNLNSNQVPLIEIDPAPRTIGAFGPTGVPAYKVRVELPASRFEGTSDAGWSYRFAISADDLRDIRSVESKDNATIIYGRTFADSVIRLNVPRDSGQS